VATGGWILGGIRTPFARAGTAFRRTPSYELGRIAAAEAIARKHVGAHPEVLATGSETGSGIPELRAELAEVGGVA